ncbi:MAG: hypothetical protein ACRDND_01265 [Streptosporangiaceae bacterium]
MGPDHAEYEEARQVRNAMIDRQPGLIPRCTSTADVVAAVNVAREHGLTPSVRCGGPGAGRRDRLVLPPARPYLRPVRRPGARAGQRRGDRDFR